MNPKVSPAATNGGAEEKTPAGGLSGAIVSPYQLLPPLTSDEYAALKADIAERGVLVPVVVDQHGRTLDGHHRRQIAAELRVDCPVEVREVADDADARDIAYRLNLTRRQLTQEQRRSLLADELRRDPTRSDRAIGRLLGCDHKTVGAMRQAIEQAARERAEYEAREQQQREDDEAASISQRIQNANRRELATWASWVVAHDRRLASDVAKGYPTLPDAAAKVRRRSGCADLGCRHAPPDVTEPDEQGGEIPHLPPWPLGTLGPYRVHPLRDVWPLMNDHDDWVSFVTNVRKVGLLHPIVLTYDRATLVDGRLRYLACEAVGIEPTFTTRPEGYTDEQICDYIFRSEMRMHHTPSQKAMVIALAQHGGGGAS